MFAASVDVAKLFSEAEPDACGVLISKAVIMRSNAGYYIGEACKYQDGTICPYARLTNYGTLAEVTDWFEGFVTLT